MTRIFITAAMVLIAAGQALAADLPQPPPPPPPQAPAVYLPTITVYNWSGIYGGINGGFGIGPSQWPGPATSPDFAVMGGLAGITAGVNLQYQLFVFGFEGDLDWQNVNGNSANGICTAPPNSAQCQAKSDWLGTFRARAGYAWDRVLFYGTAGGAVGNIRTGLTTNNYPINATELGWAAGAGTEVALADNWTIRAEYLYVKLGNVSCAYCGTQTPAFSGVNIAENIFRAGIDFKFRP